MKLRWQLSMLVLVLSAAPSIAMADQLDGFRGFVPDALVLSAIASLIIQGVGILTFNTRLGKVFTLLLGLAGSIWCTSVFKSLSKGWPRETDTSSYESVYFIGVALNIMSIALGICMVVAVLRSVFKRA